MSLFLHRAGLNQPDPVTYSCTMTAGNTSGVLQGYGNASSGIPMGSINHEPIPGQVLLQLTSGFFDSAAFEGDVTGIVAGLRVWVNGVEYPFDNADWAYNSSLDATSGIWNTAGPVFVDTVSYFVEIK